MPTVLSCEMSCDLGYTTQHSTMPSLVKWLQHAISHRAKATLTHGRTRLDSDPGRSAAQRAFLDDVLQVLLVHDYDRNVADHHASLLAHVRRTGSKRGAHDLIVAAAARATNRIVVTTDKRAGFDELPNVTARIITA